jgi:hypothetical protein
MFIPANIIDQAIDAVITTRDFCGNERDAVKQVADDHGITDKDVIAKLHRIANFRANARWRTFQIKAGVNPKHIW